MQRTKTLSFKLVVLLLITCLVMPLLQNIAVQAVDFEDRFYGFEDGTHTGWYSPWSGQLSVTNEQAYTGNKSLKISGRTHSWDSPAINIYNIIKQGGPGVYMVNMAVLVDKLVDGGEYGHLLIRGNQPNTFILPRSNGNYYCKLTSTVKFVENQWHYFTGSFVVDSVDISDESDLFNLCFDFITPTANQNIYIDNVRIEKVDPLTVIPTEATLFVGDRLILDLNRYNNLVFESSRPNVATVDGNGIVRAISPGKTTITIIYNNTEVEFCDIDVKSIEDGQYFIKNVRLDNYTQLDNDGGVIVEAWEFDGAVDQRWDITYVGEGYYKITCVSGGKAITVVDTEHANVALEVSEYIGTNTQKWRIEQLDNGNFKIMPKVAIDTNNDWGMAVGEGIGADGRNIEYRNYSNLNNQEKGQWVLRRIKNFYVDNYYDNGFLQRQNNSLSLIQECQNTVNNKFMELFTLNITAEYIGYTSKADDCKTEIYNEVSSATVNYNCTHSTNCMQTYKLRYELISDVGTGNISKSKVLWTGHNMMDYENDRSNSVYDNHTVILTPWLTTEYNAVSNTYEEKGYDIKLNEYTFDLMHELSHQLSLPDHYCYGRPNANEACRNLHCDKCYKGLDGNRECMMNFRYYIDKRNVEDLYCDDCINMMHEYLNEYF